VSGLRIGDPAPDFTLRDQFGQDVSLSSYRGTKAVAILFYPYAFSGVCTGEMAGIRDRLADFMTFDTEVLAISCDPMFALRAFAAALGLLAARGGLARLRRLRRAQRLPAPLLLRRGPRGGDPVGRAQRDARGTRPRRAPAPARRRRLRRDDTVRHRPVA
jgi:hypothetical protein